MKKIFIPSNDPPKTYLAALEKVGLNYKCSFSVGNTEDCDGLLITGGGDVCPALYENGKDVICRDVNVVKDLVELGAIKNFYDADLPIMGVCRGMQILNVFFGGTLKNADGHFLDLKKTHRIIAFSSPLCKINEVNSIHRQAADKTPVGSVVSAISPDGIIEGINFTDKIFGVQFHPEKMDEQTLIKVYGYFKDLVICRRSRRLPQIGSCRKYRTGERKSSLP